MLMTLGELHALLPGSTRVGDAATPLLRVHSDTRSLQAGDLFVALRGERHDAHAHLSAAREQGAVAAVAEHGLEAAGLPGLLVADTRVALGELAAAWRRGFDIPVIAVTGSNGKTTVTQMLASILRAWRGDAALATAGNYNNDIGLPLTLLRLRRASGGQTGHSVAVLELGMNHPGEIARLAAIAAPTVALVNNAQREHQEFMDGVDAVARENGAVIEALGAAGVAVFPADAEHTPLWHGLAGARRSMSFALNGTGRDAAAGLAHAGIRADVSGDAGWAGDHWALVLRTPVGDAGVRLDVPGLHNVRNALAAATCALAAGCPLDAVTQGLETFAPVRGRSQLRLVERPQGALTLVDDSYNANPDSVRAAIDLLVELPAPRWLVLGDMGEVGNDGPAYHREVGAHAQTRGIDALWAAGEASRDAVAAFAGARHFDTVAALIAALPEAPDCASALVKGSRFMQMERVVAALTAGHAAPPTSGGERAL